MLLLRTKLLMNKKSRMLMANMLLVQTKGTSQNSSQLLIIHPMYKIDSNFSTGLTNSGLRM